MNRCLICKNKQEKEKNIKTNKHLKNKILAYSAIKIIANPNLPYSILKPETNSDSPSAKSKGVRLVSATQEINNIIATGKNNKNINIIPNLTSYETVCAIARPM